MEAALRNNKELELDGALSILPEELRRQVLGCLGHADLASLAQGELHPLVVCCKGMARKGR